ncbi:FAD-binding protein, partial [uncultured Parasutterella sp.]|uniref:FAD-dependent oxidoreductase n=1 Tax=uncultured Parasutterella sp. TaxID=1263098 RepID=UPI0025B75E58
MKRRLLLQSGLMYLPLSALARGNLPQEYSDVIVVGGGSGGLTAALSCREYGLKVTLLEKMAFLGGDTLHSGGYFNAVTDEAVKRGEDSVVLFKQQILKSAAGYADEDVVSVYAASCGAALEWLKSQGMKFLPVPHLVYGGLWGRSYKPLQPSGTGYV